MKLAPFVHLGSDTAIRAGADPYGARQAATARRLLTRFNQGAAVQLLADEVGMGKTYVSLAVAATLLAQTGPRRVLVLVPSSELRDKWIAEIREFNNKCITDRSRWLPDARLADNLVDVVRRSSTREITVARYGAHGALSRRLPDQERRLATVVHAIAQYGQGWTARARAHFPQPAGSEFTQDRNRVKAAQHDSRPIVIRNEATTPAELWTAAREALRNAAADANVRSRTKQAAAWACAHPALWDLYRATLLRSADAFDLVIVDEVHNWLHGKHSANLVQHGVLPRARRTLFLTATPIQLEAANLTSVLERADPTGSRIAGQAARDLPDSERIRRALDRSSIASDKFRRAWSALSSPVQSNADGDPDLPEGHPFVTAFKDLDLANRHLEKQLQPWLIRHRRDRRYRRVLVGGEFAHDLQVDQRPDGHVLHPAHGFESEDAELAQLALMRLASIAERSKKPPLARSLTGCFTTPFASAELRGLVGTTEASPYEAVLERYRRDEDSGTSVRRTQHPKLKRVADFVEDQWAAGEKVVIYCNRVPTAEVLHRALARRISAHAARNTRSAAASLRSHTAANLDRIAHSLVLSGRAEVDLRNLVNKARARLAATLPPRTSYEAAHDAAQRLLLAAIVAEGALPSREAELIDEYLATRPPEQSGKRLVAKELAIKAALIEPSLVTGSTRKQHRDAAKLAKSLWRYTDRYGLAERERLIEALTKLIRSKVMLTHLLADAPAGNTLDTIVTRLGVPYGKRRRTSSRGETLWARMAAFTDLLLDLADQNRAQLLESVRAEQPYETVELVTGGSRKTRAHLLQAFNSPLSPDVLVCTQIAGEGIDLHRFCRIVIHYDLDFNPAKVEQRTGRIDRIGSKREREGEGVELIVGVPLLAGSYDERIYARLLERDQANEALLGGSLSAADDEATIDDELGTLRRHQLVDLDHALLERLRPKLHVWSNEG